MRIVINEQYLIESDEFQYILKELKEVKTGKQKGSMRSFNVGYYHSLESVLKEWMNRDLRCSNCKTFKDVADHMAKQKELIKGLIESMPNLQHLRAFCNSSILQ